MLKYLQAFANVCSCTHMWARTHSFTDKAPASMEYSMTAFFRFLENLSTIKKKKKHRDIYTRIHHWCSFEKKQQQKAITRFFYLPITIFYPKYTETNLFIVLPNQCIDEYLVITTCNILFLHRHHLQLLLCSTVLHLHISWQQTIYYLDFLSQRSSWW